MRSHPNGTRRQELCITAADNIERKENETADQDTKTNSHMGGDCAEGESFNQAKGEKSCDESDGYPVGNGPCSNIADRGHHQKERECVLRNECHGDFVFALAC